MEVHAITYVIKACWIDQLGSEEIVVGLSYSLPLQGAENHTVMSSETCANGCLLNALP